MYRDLTWLLEEQLAVVSEQKRIGDTIISDDVDINVEKKIVFKTCYSCGFIQLPRKDNCTQCKADVTKGKMHSLGLNNVGNYMEETKKNDRQRPG